MLCATELLDFVRQLPAGMAYAPIYAKGEALKSGKISKGKTPLEEGHHRVLGPEDVALAIERRPSVFKAVGVFTGPRSGGLVILDVDRNLGALLKKWGESLIGAPVIKSTKANAAKYLFTVPEEHWSEVKGFGLSDSRGGYEVLWGRQGVLYGAYPGSQDGKAPGGTYGFTGDLEAIPEAPGWLIAEMREAKGVPAGEGLIKNRKALQLDDRSDDEIAEIVQDCLRVIPQQGVGSHDHWVKVGMAIHSVLPNELGLTLWSAWSAEDVEYSDVWESANPCEERWNSFKAGGAIGLGTLIWLADQQDPKRLRFSESTRKIVEGAEAAVQKTRQELLGFDEVMREAKVLMELDNPAEMNFKLNQLSLRAGYRDQSALERLIVDQIQFEGQTDTMSLKQLMQTDFKREYLIPDLLPCPAVVLIYGAGGDGKSMSAWTLAKHIATGAPFVIRGKAVPVQAGPVLLLNGDQPLVQLQEQLDEVGMPMDAPVTLRSEWSIQRYAQFVKLMKDVKPKLVVIDSLIGCSGGKAFDENKSDFASPLYWLTRNNGILFPAATILIIHHANKQGGFRGTSAIRDAVDETWSLSRPSSKQLEETGQDARIVTIEKSRSGRGGTRLIMRQEADLSFTLADWTPEQDSSTTAPSGITDRVLARLRTVYPYTRSGMELNSDPVCGGSVTAIRKSLQRLLKRRLICVAFEEAVPGRGGKPTNHYQAVLSSHAQGALLYRGPNGGERSDGLESSNETPPLKSSECPVANDALEEEGGTGTGAKETPPVEMDGCPIVESSDEQGFDAKGHDFESIRVREEDRTTAELDALKAQAEEAWSAGMD